MTVEQITLRCNGPVTAVGPIGNCATTRTSRSSYTVDMARGDAARDGWAMFMDGGLVFDLCPEHKLGRPSPDARTTGT